MRNCYGFRAILWMLAIGILLTVCPLRGVAQGGQGGFGGGMGGFAGGFGAGGRAGSASDGGDSASYKHILTPGDRGEWPLTVRAGEAIIVHVTSTTFDPAAQIVDAAGKVLAENDDVRPGDQDSLILYRFATAGEYKILVKGFKSVAGGQYTLTLRRFLPTDLRRGERNATQPGKTYIQWHRFSAVAGETLVVTTRSAVFDPSPEIYAPNGEQVEAQKLNQQGGKTTSLVFRAETAGDYYLRVTREDGNSGGYAVTVAAARVAPIAIGTPSPNRHLAAGGLDLWTFTGSVDDLLHVVVQVGSTGASVALKFVPTAEKVATEISGNERSLVPMPSDPKAHGEIVALLRRPGLYQVEVSQPQGLEVDYTLSLNRYLKPWPANQEINTKLALGGSDYYAIDGKAGQVIRVAGLAEPFDITLMLYNSRGEPIEGNDDGDGGRNALLTTLLKETGRYILHVSAYGNGGSGPYKLIRRPDPTRPLPIATRTEGKIGTGSNDVWSFTGKAGQTLILSVRSQDFDPHVTVFGPDAIEVANENAKPEGADTLLSLHLPLDGTYTLWISAQRAGGKYVIRLINAD